MIQEGSEAFKEGDYHYAIEVWSEAASIYENSLKAQPINPVSARPLLTCWGNLASAYRHVGNINKEIEILNQSKDKVKQCFGANHPQYTNLMFRIGEAHEDMGETKMMKEVVVEALKLLENKHRSSKNELNMYRGLLLLSRAHAHLNEHKQQLEVAQRAMDIVQQHYGPENIHVTTASLVLAKAYGDNGNVKLRVQMAEKVYEIQSSQMGQLQGQLERAAMELAAAYKAEKNNSKEIEYLEKAIEIHKKSFESLPPSKLVDIELLLGDAHVTNYVETGLVHYLEAQKLVRCHLTSPCIWQCRALMKAAQCYKLLNDSNKYVQLLREAQKSAVALAVSKDHSLLVEINEALRSIESL